jgi:hypothetical protein
MFCLFFGCSNLPVKEFLKKLLITHKIVFIVLLQYSGIFVLCILKHYRVGSIRAATFLYSTLLIPALSSSPLLSFTKSYDNLIFELIGDEDKSTIINFKSVYFYPPQLFVLFMSNHIQEMQVQIFCLIALVF